MLAASTTSIFLPVMSMIRLRTVRKMKSKTIAIAMPMASAMRDAIAPFGTTRS